MVASLNVDLTFTYRNLEESESEVLGNLKMLNSWIHWGYHYIGSSWVITFLTAHFAITQILFFIQLNFSSSNCF